MPNRLAGATSPYLLQHKDNPVDWYPWGEEAFQKAKGEGKPVFLSVGYSSCHWCHVMEHESFEDEEVAKLLNEHFVSVKVDREERPDVDEAYMTAVQLSSGRGGWPMSVFLTPDKQPFFAGTYFPKEDHAGFPGFKSVLRQIAVAWATKREDIEKTGQEFENAIRQALTQGAPGTFETLKPEINDEAIKAAAGQFDREHGGSQGAPKFPPHSNLELMLHCALREGTTDELREAAVAMPLVTLEKMCLGGIHDHVGGGFHRYSTDEKWLLPHFEKMLYDNALMLGNLARGSMIAAHVAPRLEALFTRAAMGVLSWLVREMTSPEGLFYSAVDADSEGEEGKFYVWNADEIRALLGERAQPFMEAFGVEDDGNFFDEATHEKTGANILHLKQDDQGQFAAELEILRKARESRVRPGLDYKALVAWNGLTIRSLADLGALSMAERCAQTLLSYEQRHGRLPHQITNGTPSGEAFLDGYAFLAHGLFGLAGVREHVEADPAAFKDARVDSSFSAAHWRQNAERLTQEMVARFYDEEKGGFFNTSDGHEELFGRTKPAFDHPVPSANGVAIRCLIELGDLDRARKSLEGMMGWMQRAPQATETLHLAALELFDMDGDAAPSEEVRVEASPQPAAKLPAADVRVTLEPRELRVGPDGSASGKVLIEVPEGLHLNSNEPPARWLIPTRVEVEPLSAVIHYPPGKQDRYEGLIEIPFTVRLPDREDGSDMELRVSFQACTEQECLLPQERLLSGIVVR